MAIWKKKIFFVRLEKGYYCNVLKFFEDDSDIGGTIISCVWSVFSSHSNIICGKKYLLWSDYFNEIEEKIAAQFQTAIAAVLLTSIYKLVSLYTKNKYVYLHRSCATKTKKTTKNKQEKDALH